jgi:hypothetical protein
MTEKLGQTDKIHEEKYVRRLRSQPENPYPSAWFYLD